MIKMWPTWPLGDDHSVGAHRSNQTSWLQVSGHVHVGHQCKPGAIRMWVGFICHVLAQTDILPSVPRPVSQPPTFSAICVADLDFDVLD